MLLLLKELNLNLAKVQYMLRLAGVYKNGLEDHTKHYKLNYALLQNIYEFCEKYDLSVSFDVFADCVRTANFMAIVQESNRKNCWKCMLMYVSKVVNGSHRDQEEWYKKATSSIGITKSYSRKGVGNLPVGFDKELRRIVSGKHI